MDALVTEFFYRVFRGPVFFLGGGGVIFRPSTTAATVLVSFKKKNKKKTKEKQDGARSARQPISVRSAGTGIRLELFDPQWLSLDCVAIASKKKTQKLKKQQKKTRHGFIIGRLLFCFFFGQGGRGLLLGRYLVASTC